MKKLLAMMLSGLMVLSLTACGNGQKTETPAPTAAPTEAGQADNTTEAAPTEGQTKAAGGEKLIVATEAGFAPYEYLVGDQVVGIDMDIAQAVADKMGRELEIQNMDFDGALLAVQQGKVDFVAAGVSVDEDRAKVMDFSINYVDSTEVVIVNAELKAVAEPTGEALADKVVGVQQGNIADLWVSNTDNAAPKDIRRYTKFAQAAEDLKNGKIDCIIMDELPGKELVEASDGALVILDGDPLFVDQYAIAVQKGNTEMLEVINEVITELQESGKLDEIISSHGVQ